MIKEKEAMENTELTIEDMELFRDILGGKEHNPTLIQETDTGYVILTRDNPEEFLNTQNLLDDNVNQGNDEPVYNFGRTQTRTEMRENMEEDGRMTHDEIEEWLDSLEM